MDKQEEIREGIKHILRIWQVDSDVEFCATGDIIKYLHENNVVIKVEGELPKRIWFHDWGGESGRAGYKLALEDMKSYVKTMPLIKEG